MSLGYEKIKTIEKFAKDFFLNQAQDKSLAYPFPMYWEAAYSVEVKKVIKKNQNIINEEGEASKRIKTTTLYALDIKNSSGRSFFKTSSSKTNISPGDIANDFLSIFKPPVNNSPNIEDEIDIDALNIFLSKYQYPAVNIEAETNGHNQISTVIVGKMDNAESNNYIIDEQIPKSDSLNSQIWDEKEPLVIWENHQNNENFALNETTDTENFGIDHTFSTVGYVKTHRAYYPMDKDIEDYIHALRRLFDDLYVIRTTKVGSISFDLNYLHYFNLNTKSNTTFTYHKNINSLILLDASNALDKYDLLKCIRCGKLYFKNKGQKVCPYGCKPPSLMTKAEIAQENIKSSNLSNNYRRLAFLKKLNREGLSFEEKNKRLKEEGFELLKSKKKK
ncbi:MAG: hypothetical protein KMY55_15670 [Dethiosulfatibacter sp.]|nr:hypothetical protein [Dethiosulfatibacter sp.]